MDSICGEITLEQVDDWFRIGKTVKVKTIPASKTRGRLLDSDAKPICFPNERQYVPPYKR